ncbi:MAG: family 2 glycosyl transferase [Paenibacillus sp.]|nr:family 2 glycosyl transferase [Paenibacillus sp.]
MKGLRIKLRGVSFRYARDLIRKRSQTLAYKKKQLRRQRRVQTESLQRLEEQSEELKRRLAAAQRRIRLLESGEPYEWATFALKAEAERAAQEEKARADEVAAALAAAAPPPPKPRLGDQLLAMGFINEDQLAQAIERQRQFGGRLGDVMIELGFVTEEQLAQLNTAQPSKLRLGDMLVQNGYLTAKQLEKALAFQKKSGGLLGDVLLSLRLIEPEELYRAIANQNSMGRIGNETGSDPHIKLPEELARQYGVVIIHEYPNRLLLAVNNPLPDEQKRELEAILHSPVEQVLATQHEMERFWSNVYGEEMMHQSTTKLAEEQPHNSASTTFTKGQLIAFAIMAGCFVLGLLIQPMNTLIYLNVAIQLFYFLMSLFKFAIIMYGTRRGAQFRFTREELQQIDERELPMYTILVPMYKEGDVIPQLLANLERLDYPKAKLDVRLLIEEDDVEAQDILKHMRLPSYYSVLVVPASMPKTKPKACNYGLIRAKGEYVVIFDAEDRPDPDQLKKVHLTFKACSESTVCVQAKLNYFNSEQNMLTRWFTQEYSMWFELLLPGIMQLNIPIPLGGTSNHFKTEALKQVNAWDPYNVTEDADLGIRLYKEGYKTAIVDSRTWEEATSRVGNWIRQRSRWIKGYMQTWLVHMRNPIRTWRELGTQGFFGFHVMVLATPMLPLLNPLFWALLLLWYLAKVDFIPLFFPGPIYYLAAFQLFVGNFIFIYSLTVGVFWVTKELRIKGSSLFSYSLVKYSLLSPLYWVLMSIAAVKAAIQLITKPFYWEKTTHGHATDKSPHTGSEFEKAM